jgi:prepilin-type N-terminal cleavage/methylation domain-containing protein
MFKLLHTLHTKEHGFTMVELLIVIGILGVLAGVLVPRLNQFMSTSQVAAANQEVASVESAVKCYWADHNGQWPPNDCNTDLLPDYINQESVHYNYEFNADGLVIVPDGQASAVDPNIEWDDTYHLWKKG